MDNTPKTTQKIKKPIERSASYPAVDLETAINLSLRLKNSLGNGPYSRLSAAQGIGYKSITGSSAVRVAALTHYGLLVRTGDTYSLSPLVKRILIETSAEDKSLAIQEAAKTPKLFKNLVKKYSSASLPQLLRNILVSEFGITEKAAPNVVKDFTKTLEYADLLKNGIVSESYDSEQPGDDGFREESGRGQRSPETSNAAGKGYPVSLPSGITIVFPKEFVYHVTLGEFAESIKGLETIAQVIIKKTNESKESMVKG